MRGPIARPSLIGEVISCDLETRAGGLISAGSIVLLLVSLAIVRPRLLVGQEQAEATRSPLEVKISTIGKSFALLELVRVRVRITNKGDREILLCHNAHIYH